MNEEELLVDAREGACSIATDIIDSSRMIYQVPARLDSLAQRRERNQVWLKNANDSDRVGRCVRAAGLEDAPRCKASAGRKHEQCVGRTKTSFVSAASFGRTESGTGETVPVGRCGHSLVQSRGNRWWGVAILNCSPAAHSLAQEVECDDFVRSRCRRTMVG